MKHFTELVQGNGAIEGGCMDRESSLDREEGEGGGGGEEERGRKGKGNLRTVSSEEEPYLVLYAITSLI